MLIPDSDDFVQIKINSYEELKPITGLGNWSSEGLQLVQIKINSYEELKLGE